MAAQNQQQKFFEIIKPGSTFEFIGMQRYWIGLSIVLVALTVVMLPLNAFVFKSRGHMLNWGVDFRGGTELVVEFSKPVDAGEIRKVLADAGHDNADVVKYEDPTGKSKYNFMLRIGAVSVLSEAQAKQIARAAGQGGRRHAQEVRVVRGRRQDLPALRPARSIRSRCRTRSRRSASRRPRCSRSAAPRRTPTR